MIKNTVNDIREELIRKYQEGEITIDQHGNQTVEILNTTFIADEPFILREPNEEYIKRELDWYISRSRNINDIPPPIPAIWKLVAGNNGLINSNYGWCIFSPENGKQFWNVTQTLAKNPSSRRATMIYNRPSMHTDYNAFGMNDFMCTYAQDFAIRDNQLHSHYIMRSNDAVFGYNNDYAWAHWVHECVFKKLSERYPELTLGELSWTASSLHVYERHFAHLEKNESND